MYIVADIGGTKTRIAGSRDLASFGTPVIIDTPQKYEDGLATLIQTAKDISEGEPIEAIAAGIPALLSRDRSTIVSATTNIPDWSGKNIKNDLASVLNTHVCLENDVALVGLGEAVSGAGKGADIVMYLTVSTGVNGVRIVRGTIDPAVFGTALGHQYVSLDTNAGMWEERISGRAIERKYGMHPKELGKDSPVWEELAPVVAFGLHNSILHWSPDRVVLGGSMFNEIGISVERVQFHLQKIMTAMPELPDMVHANLEDLGGLWGGLARLKQGKN